MSRQTRSHLLPIVPQFVSAAAIATMAPGTMVYVQFDESVYALAKLVRMTGGAMGAAIMVLPNRTWSADPEPLDGTTVAWVAGAWPLARIKIEEGRVRTCPQV